jgi:hypothetical protein
MTEDTKKAIMEAIMKRMASPKQYTMDNESILMDTPDDLAKLIKMLEATEEPKKSNSPFKIAVCKNNSPII